MSSAHTQPHISPRTKLTPNYLFNSFFSNLPDCSVIKIGETRTGISTSSKKFHNSSKLNNTHYPFQHLLSGNLARSSVLYTLTVNSHVLRTLKIHVPPPSRHTYYRYLYCINIIIILKVCQPQLEPEGGSVCNQR